MRLERTTIEPPDAASGAAGAHGNNTGSGMGKLYDYCSEIQRYIDGKGLDVFKTRGALAIECGFLITLIGENDPDDADKIIKLREAARTVLGLRLE